MAMKRVIGVISATGCAALLIGGCGTTRAPSGGASPSSSGSTTASTTPKTRAAADAASILQSFVPPSGAVRLTAAPDADHGALGRPVTPVASPNTVDNVSWWRVKGTPQAVLAWEKSHISSRFKATGSGSGFSVGHQSTMWSQQYSLPPVPGLLDQRQLAVSAVNDGEGQTALRVDSQVTWLPAKPASERIPASAKAVTISASPGVIRDGKVPAPVTITSAATVEKIASLVEGLPVFPPGRYSCPADIGKAVQMTFRGSATGPALAVVTADLTGCQAVSFTVGGKKQPGLSGGASAAQQVLAASGLHWNGYSTGVARPGGGGSTNPSSGGAVNPGGVMQPAR